MELFDFDIALNDFEKYLSIKNREIRNGFKAEEAFKDKWKEEKNKLNKKYFDLKSEIVLDYEDTLKPYDLAFISVYVGFYDSNVNKINEDGPIAFIKEKTIEDINTNYEYYFYDDIINNQYGMRHKLVSNTETIFEELYDEPNLNPFEDEKEAFIKMFSAFDLLNQGKDITAELPKTNKDEQIKLILSIFPIVKDRQDKLDALDKELFYKINDIDKRFEMLYHQKTFDFIDYDIIEDAKMKYMSPIEMIYGQGVYKILMRIADEVVDSDQKRFIRLAKSANIQTTEDLYEVIDEAFYGNF